MSESGARRSHTDEDMDAEGFRIDARTETEEYHQTKEVREDRDRTEIHVKDEKVVKLEELKTKETRRLASPEEVRALIEAEFEGLDEIGAGTEITVEEFNRKESRHEKTVEGQPVIKISLTEEHKSEEVKEDPQWKKEGKQFPDLEDEDEDEETEGEEKEMSFSFAVNPLSIVKTDVVAASEVPSVEVPQVVAIPSEEVTLTASTTNPASDDVDMSITRPKGVAVETSVHGKKKKVPTATLR